MIELLLESPLPCFLASSTAYTLLTSHQLQCQLLPILIASWTFALFVHLVVWLSWIFPRYVSELRHIPTVPGFPLWGQFFDVITQEYGTPQRLWHHQYGPVVRYFFPFGSERLSIAERAALQRMAFDCPKTYVGNCAKPSQAHSLIGRTLRLGLLLDQSSQHDYRSSALALAFSVQSIKTLVPVIWTISLCLGECWKETNASGRPNATTVEALCWLKRLTLDIISRKVSAAEMKAVMCSLLTFIETIDHNKILPKISHETIQHYPKMSESVNAFDPLERYVSDPSALRKALDESNALVDGFWTLSAFVSGEKVFLERLKRHPLRIIIPRKNNWVPISTVLESDGYQLRGNYRAPHGGVLFVRENDDNLSLEFDDEKDLGWKNSKSLQAKTLHRVMSEGFGCFMTSKYAVLVCGLQPRSADGDPIEKMRKSIVARYETQPQGSAKERWTKLGDRICSIVEVEDVDTERDSFNKFLSGTDVFSMLSELTQSIIFSESNEQFDNTTSQAV
ncbi:hypothetical protein FOC4_g10000603 [Fusarium odoratissimum]|uniref:Uncharacterized protein n=3 Tax=Fusarium oxysporum species complex TaxID=171631 RepID=N1RV65_FUSC4|nr:hypothetical protein FOC4_g10000603 [Fusarium odoratissimum]